MINIEEIETEASQARDAINAILGHFTVRTGCTLALTQKMGYANGSFEITSSEVGAQVILGVKA